ncbi:Protein translocase subunit SecA [hydrothermal vent metagenome]|uniref:Protein translocase subunit SecA n=1 Tax=hydrothermal vent metagenome TaxID=652676 RepID=A0A3B0SJ88_9ZZZZ
MLKLVQKMFGSSNDRLVRRMQPRIDQINGLEAEFEKLSDQQVREKMDEFRKRYKDGETLDELLPEVFANVREAAKRTLGQRHFDVQLIGGMVLHEGSIAEMRTGEGKTLVATLAASLNALPGKGVHVVTVNDYLAERDVEWMGQVYGFLGLSSACIINGKNDAERKEAYACDITYGTNNEYGFDYLRDNMKNSLEQMVQREHFFAIVDEVDSILIDEARTPLVISGPTEDRSDFYKTIDALIPGLEPEDYEHDEKQRSVSLTEVGNEKLEKKLVELDLMQGDFYDIENVSVVHHVNMALRAHKIYIRDKDYIVRDNQIMLIDEFTGRMMDGRRLGDGQHQAVEAKEAVEIQPENVTLASITYQNYFRLYKRLCGMTGTAATEAAEFESIYGLGVVEIPTNRPVMRVDIDDELYRTNAEKYQAVIADVKERSATGQPILVGTVSIEKSEELSRLFSKEKVKHSVLNARFHEQEAEIISQAGAPGAVTIATNMAGRGTDIQLGGNLEMLMESWERTQSENDKTPDKKAIARQLAVFEEQVNQAKKQVIAAGGLYVLATERHESRRIDNQLRGRTGRQGDPGLSKFYVSVEDDLMRIFAPERMNTIMKTLGMKDGEAIAHPWMNKALETSQKKVEARNFEIRKNLLKYDDVANDQRKAIFEQRREFMAAEDVSEVINDMRHEALEDLVDQYMPSNVSAAKWDLQTLETELTKLLAGTQLPVTEWANEEGVANDEILERLEKETDRLYASIVAKFGPEEMRPIEKHILLSVIDYHWQEHLQNLDHMKSTIHLRSYAQRDPLNEFKSESFALFENLLSDLRASVTENAMTYGHMQLQPVPEATPLRDDLQQNHGATDSQSQVDANGFVSATSVSRQASSTLDPNDPSSWGRVARNTPCPCGSGKKFKRCHGAI